MQLDPEYLRQHYASLSDEALVAVDRADLVEMARMIFDLEVRSRNLAALGDTGRSRGQHLVPQQPDAPHEEAEVDEAELNGEAWHDGDKPGWLEDASDVYSWTARPGVAHAPDAALDAQDALEAAGVPCHLDLCELPREATAPEPTHIWRLVAPAKHNLRAKSVLERDVSNPEFEAYWKTHLDALSDEELRAMPPQVALCGLFDLIQRVNRVYAEEMARRKLK